MVLKQQPRNDTINFLLLLFLPPGLNDPAPAAGKETSENNQWSMFEVQRRSLREGEGGIDIVGGLRTHCHLGEACDHRQRGSLA